MITATGGEYLLPGPPRVRADDSWAKHSWVK